MPGDGSSRRRGREEDARRRVRTAGIVAVALTVLGAAGCGAVASSAPVVPGGTRSAPAGGPPIAGPSAADCSIPTTPERLNLGTQVIVEPGIVHGRATGDGVAAFLPEGRHVLLLGASTPTVIFALMGREGAFRYADPAGTRLRRLCTVLSAGPLPSPPTEPPASIDRATLLDLAIRAATTWPPPSPGSVSPVPVP